MEIYNSVREDMGLSTGLLLVDCGGADCGGRECRLICGAQGDTCECRSGAWCYSDVSTIYCRGDRLETASDDYLSRLFRHELWHRVQARNAGTWPSWGTSERVNVTEWGADEVSGNGG